MYNNMVCYSRRLELLLDSVDLHETSMCAELRFSPLSVALSASVSLSHVLTCCLLHRYVSRFFPGFLNMQAQQQQAEQGESDTRRAAAAAAVLG